MRRTQWALLVLALVSVPALAQTSDFTPPPMVPSGPPPVPANEPGVAQPGTPPPPGAVPPSAFVPSTQPPGAAFSPYGQPRSTPKPGPEVGLMVSESLFGMLTAAGVAVLPYYLLFGTGQSLGDDTVSSVIFILIFCAVPLAVAQTQVSLANGSRNYASEQWPAALAGLAAQAAVLGLFYATGWLGQTQASGGTPRTGGSVALLLVGTVALVPLIQMAVINLTKEPKFQFSALEVGKGGQLSLGLPMPAPLIAQTRQGTAVGVSLSLLSGRF